MNDCWEVDPQNRPGFHYVSLQLSRQLHGPAQVSARQLDIKCKPMRRPGCYLTPYLSVLTYYRNAYAVSSL